MGEAISTIFTLTESSIPRLDHSDSYPTLFPQIAVGIIHAAHTAYDVHPHNARLQKLTHWKIILLCNQHPEIGWAVGWREHGNESAHFTFCCAITILQNFHELKICIIVSERVREWMQWAMRNENARAFSGKNSVSWYSRSRLHAVMVQGKQQKSVN